MYSATYDTRGIRLLPHPRRRLLHSPGMVSDRQAPVVHMRYPPFAVRICLPRHTSCLN